MHIFFIGPVRSDPRFPEKQDILGKVAAKHDCTVFLPLKASSEHRLSDVMLAMTEAKCVIADLSFERPSCYYELGVAEALGSHVETMAEADTEIHQVENPNSVNVYRTLEEFERLVNEIFLRTLRPLAGTETRTHV